jgi:predicted porin
MMIFAACGLFSGWAHAGVSAKVAGATVDIYGIVDAGVMTQNRSGATGQLGNSTGFVDGALAPTLFGIKGSKKLDRGLTASFTLEAGVSTANGQTANSTGVSTDIFGRQANAAIGGKWGTITGGMQLDPAFLASISTEPRGLADSFSMLSQWVTTTIFNGGGPGQTGSLQGGIFDQSAVSYTYSGRGLYVGLEHGFGGVAGNNSANSTSSIGLTYSRKGWTGSAAWAVANSATPGVGKQSRIVDVGLGYDSAGYAVRGQAGEFNSGYSGGVAAHQVHIWGVGLDLKGIPENVLNVAYYGAKDEGAGAGGSTRELALLDKYDLGQGLIVYGQVAQIRADANAGNSAALGGIYTPGNGLFASAGVSTTFVGAGLQYMF